MNFCHFKSCTRFLSVSVISPQLELAISSAILNEGGVVKVMVDLPTTFMHGATTGRYSSLAVLFINSEYTKTSVHSAIVASYIIHILCHQNFCPTTYYAYQNVHLLGLTLYTVWLTF